MKKIKLFLLVFFAIGYVGAQNIEYQSADNYLRNNQLIKAKDCIDKASIHNDTKIEPKTWYKKGEIYITIHRVKNMVVNLKEGMTKEQVKQILGDPVFMRNAKNSKGVKMEKWSYTYDVALFFDDSGKLSEWNEPEGGGLRKIEATLPAAYEAFQKCIELDEKKEYSQASKLQLFVCGEQFYNEGVGYYNQKQYKDAIVMFERTISINNLFGVQDSLATYNAAVSAELSNINDKAKKHYAKLISMDFKEPMIYSSLSRIFKEDGDTLKALEVIKLGRKRYPDNNALLIEETNIYLISGQNEKASANLEIAIERDPKNPNLHYVIGTQYFDKLKEMKYETDPKTYDQMFKTAEKYLTSAIELKPDYFEASFNLGALYVNEGVRLFEIADKMTDMKLYAAEQAKFEGIWTKAVLNMEKALSLNPEDFDTLVTLKQLYARMKMTEKFKIVNDKLTSMQQKK